MATVSLRFYAELNDLAGGGLSELGSPARERAVSRGQTVKDLIEAAGVPHTEVDLVLVNGESVSFEYQVCDGDRVSVFPVFESLDVGPVTRVRAVPLRETRFAADAHLGKLARYLRILGFDTAYRTDWADAVLVEAAQSEKRIILTRDHGLLKRAAVDHGCLIRETCPRAQLVEVLTRFDLARSVRPFTRCPRCNGPVSAVSKAEIGSSLPPRTAALVQEFKRCQDCGHLYWQGAHQRGLNELLSLAQRVDRAADNSPI